MRRIVVSSDGFGYGFLVDDDGRLRQAGFGSSIEAHMEGLSEEIGASLYPLAYPAYDQEPTRAPALRVTHSDGTTTTHLVLADAISKGSETQIVLVDSACPIEVRLCLRPEEHGVIRQWVSITNHQSAAVVLHEVAAASPLLATPAPHLMHFGGGDWAAEWTSTLERLSPGTKVVDSRGGVQPHLRCCPFFLLAPDGPPQEAVGAVVAGGLAWGGNVRFGFERTTAPTTRVWCGHNPASVDYVLSPGDTFVSPDQIWSWSDEGTGPLSRRLHGWVRGHAVRDGGEQRPVVVNNWEATGFSFDTDRILTLIDQAADLGAELFLLDDGWFGDGRPRNDDTAGLGDWRVNETKLPGGLAPLLLRAAERGIRFGLWVEPEMVSPESRLYADHPDWVVGQPARRPRTFRHQLVLNVLQPEVARFVHGVMDRIVAENPGISYLKWDANRPLTDPGSSTLPSDRQANVWVDQPRATWNLMEAVAKSHPALTLMLCASGGGRLDLGSLRWFHEVWLSDNTDPVDRVRMQWAASYFLPANVVAAHVTRWGNRPIAFACAVAMSARFGFDVDLAGLSEEERAICRRAVQLYREIRPVVQLGDLWRLVEPEEHGSLAYASRNGDRAVVFGFQIETRTAGVNPLYLGGLHADQTYEITTVDLAAETTSEPVYRRGADLIERGLEWPLTEAFTACIWTLTASTSF